jgi:hypothetical protein
LRLAQVSDAENLLTCALEFPILFFASFILSNVAFADDGKVVISSPANGATFNKTDNVELMYEALPGTDGDHLHLNLDGKRVDVIHALTGKASVGMLPPGKHHICLAVNTKGHMPTGVEACIDVASK